MAGNFNFEKFKKLRLLCKKVNEAKTNPTNEFIELRKLIKSMEFDSTPLLQETVLASMYKYLIPEESNGRYKEHLLREIIDTLSALFEKTRIMKLPLFFNIYAFSFTKIFDVERNKIANDVSEEIKQSVVICLKTLLNSLSWDVLLDLYCKDNVLKLGQMLYILLELAKLERFRQLRIESMEGILALTQINSQSKLNDVEILSKVANIFAHYLPGITIAMKHLALEDEKSGHKITQMAVRTFGRITVLMMKDYERNGAEMQPDLQIYIKEINQAATNDVKDSTNICKERISDSIKNMKRDKEWFTRCDKNLKIIILSLQRLTKHQHDNVRFELADISNNIVQNCTDTMPNSIGPLLEIIITLAQDDCPRISDFCQRSIDEFMVKLSTTNLKILVDHLEEMFFEAIGKLPKIFNGFDEYEQIATLNLVLGYLKILGCNNLEYVIKSVVHIKHLILTLMHICEFELFDHLLLQQYIVQDLDMIYKDKRTPWQNFKYFRSDVVKNKLMDILKILGNEQYVQVVFAFLSDIYIGDENNVKQAIFFLNEVLTANYFPAKINYITETINLYMDTENSNLPIRNNENDDRLSLKEIQQNTIHLCLQIEGIGKFALTIGETYDKFLLQTLYPILEYTGSGNGLLRLAGLQAIENIAIATKCQNITDLINNNSDYFSYHVMRKLKRFDCPEHSLNVLCIVLNYSEMNVLESISDIINEVVYYSSTDINKEKATSYLRLFDVIMSSMHRWLDIKIEALPFKSRSQQQQELETFKISNIQPECKDFGDNLMQKSAEEMFAEDMNKDRQELEDELDAQEEPYKNPDPSKHIKLTVKILQNSLNYLSSKSVEKQLLSLKILKNGVEIIRDWEDELLPIVHLIWGPLVGRFHPESEPLIINLSFQLLLSLGRLSKDFIRSRTAKEVLPNLSKIMHALKKESYLKDKGNAYRYKQAYKLQLVVLEHLGQLLVNLDIGDTYIGVGLSSILPYLSNKQPLPLQKFAVQSCKTLVQFDPQMMEVQLKKLNVTSEFKINVEDITSSLCK